MASIRSAFQLTRLAAIAGVLFCAGHQPVDAATFVKVVGTRARNSATVSNSSTTVSVPSSGVAAGDSLIVTVQVQSLGGAIACSDTINGAYNTDVVSPAGGAGIAIASRHNAAALGFGDVITCTYPAFDGASSMSVHEFSGLETVNVLDRTAQSSSASSHLVSSGLTATTSQAGELVFGLVWLPDATQVFSPATSGGNPFEIPYAPPWTQPSAIGTQKPIFRFVNTIRQYEANGTVGPVGGWIAQLATYRLLPDPCAGVSCDDGNACTADACDPATGACLHAPEAAGLRCGSSSSGICDLSDRCDGAGVCNPRNIADGTPCSEVDSDCEIQDTCLAGVCHENGVKAQGTLCGDPVSGPCDAPDTCDASGFCDANVAADGAACGDAGTACINADSCLAGACQDAGFVAAGGTCGDSSSGACDGADSCDGSGSCLVNHVANGTSCGDAGSECVNADGCEDGLCRDNGFVTAGDPCGDSSSGACDGADSCDGSGSCLTNHVADGTSCGDDGTACVNQDLCEAGLCHDNGFVAAGAECGDPSSSTCDGADSCDGSGACLSNLVADGTSCGDAGSECTNQDVCEAGVCDDNGFKAAGTECGDSSSGVCDGADSCDGAGSCSANHATAGLSCSDGEVCTEADACNGSGQCVGAADELCFACKGNTAPVVAPAVIASPLAPMALGSGFVVVTASFMDSPGQIRICTISWGDGSEPDAGVVTEPGEGTPGSCVGTHLYTAVGVYEVSISVADPCGESAAAVYQYAVVYDPSAGFVTGGGWIVSPPGAYVPNPVLTGKAFFGFVSGYFKGNSNVPTGRTDFHFHAAGFHFSSSTYEWLVISGAKARFRGTGQVNGSGLYGFAVTAWDGQVNGGGGVDRFRIRIWDENRGDAVVYDNQVACPAQGDNADPCIALGGGAIVVHKK